MIIIIITITIIIIIYSFDKRLAYHNPDSAHKAK